MKAGSIAGKRYQIIREIGSGGMSVVYLARDLTLKQEWAVKVVRKGVTPQEIWKERQLLSEAMLMKRLDHPGFPRIVDLFEENECTCIVMDYIEGETLDVILNRDGPCTERQVTAWARQLCDILIYLHTMERPVFYCDLKPSNIICARTGRLYLIDFGIAAQEKMEGGIHGFAASRKVDGGTPGCAASGKVDGGTPGCAASGKVDGGTPGCAASGKVDGGTPGFAAPEQLRNGICDARTDIYSLGMTIYTLLTGLDPRSPAFHKMNREEVLQFPQSDVYCSAGIQEIVRRCTCRNPKERYRNGRELMRDLLQPVRPAALKRRRDMRRRILSAAVIISVLLLSAAAIFQRAVREFTEEEIYAAKLDPAATQGAEEKERSYLEAIDLQPDSSDGFLRLLGLYETEMDFKDRESRQLLLQFHQCRTALSADPDMWNEILCRIGKLYFFRFQGGDGSVRERILRAEPFFAEWNPENEKEKEKETDSAAGTNQNEDAESSGSNAVPVSDAECLREICSFYKGYVSASTNMEEPGQDTLRSMLQAVSSLLVVLDHYHEEDRTAVQLTILREMAEILNVWRYAFFAAGVEEQEMLELMNQIINKVDAAETLRADLLEEKQKLEVDCEVFTEQIRLTWEQTDETAGGNPGMQQ
ncbi:MAG: serine/threonine protein kinase [Eubacterium sp.]|nr:serine/threonine protein kinase [Eubacterium sp.]